MGLQPPLFIGSKVDAEDGKDKGVLNSFQQIERWSAAVTVPSSGYASLTGLGETTTPGALTQAGGLTVNDGSAVGINLNETGTGGTTAINSGSGDTDIAQTGTGNIRIVKNGIGGAFILISTTDTGGITVNDSGGGGITIQCSHVASGDLILSTHNNAILSGNTVAIALLPTQQVGFYGVPPVAQQAAPTTLAQVITVLHNLGLTA